MNLKESFKNPPPGYGTVPFYWWVGDPLTEERLKNQLEKLAEHSITGLQINYPHDCEGGVAYGHTYKSEPELFSESWWDLFGWMMSECKKYGISLSVSDYTLGIPGQGWFIDEILEEYPEMRGQLLKSHDICCRAHEMVRINLPVNTLAVSYHNDKTLVDLSQRGTGGYFDYMPEQDGIITLIFNDTIQYSIDPMHPQTGTEICDRFFGRFVERFPEEAGKGLNFFFSDELNFGIEGMLWNDFFRDEFYKRKGYDILPELPCLFHLVGQNPVKVRLDYYDVIIQLQVEHYFKVVYQWHEKNNMIYGCDHGGRGKVVNEFGDYYRTQSYNQGPGCDQPFLQYDIIKNKVASSIAHIYNRPRVWLEGFYGSGWGTTTEELCTAISRNYAMGHNLLSLHGLYYSTYGGWWEWAPPCNCFRMPYWEDMKHLLKATERLSFLMSQGVHCCDTAIVYPVAAVEGGIKGNDAVETAFECAEKLYRIGYDLDFIDYESIDRAHVKDKKLNISGESYKLIVLPSMVTVRFGMIQKLKAFAEDGGIVVIIGDIPRYSDCDTDIQPYIESLLECEKVFAVETAGGLLSLVETMLDKGITGDIDGDLFINHRRVGDQDIYFVHGLEKGREYLFESKGKPVCFNAFDGLTYELIYRCDIHGTYVTVPDLTHGFMVIVFDSDYGIADKSYTNIYRNKKLISEVMNLDGKWTFELQPCLDNQFGDFSLPQKDEIIGAQVRRMHHMTSDVFEYQEDRNSLRNVMYSYGEYYLFKDITGDTDKLVESVLGGDLDGFEPYEISMRYGKWGDPGNQGYHGLKGKVTDDYLVIGQAEKSPIGMDYIGDGRAFLTYVYTDDSCEARILSGTKKPDMFFINNKQVWDMNGIIELNKGFNSVLAIYNTPGRTHLLFAEKSFTPKKYPLSMSWFDNKAIYPMDCYGGRGKNYNHYIFSAPPAIEKMLMTCEAEPLVWIDDNEARVEKVSGNQYLVYPQETYMDVSNVTITIPKCIGKHGGALIHEPINLMCGRGLIDLGDWSEIDGLRSYSGGVVYGYEIQIVKDEGCNYMLEIDDLISTVSVYINNLHVGTKVAPDWSFNITDYICTGLNSIRLTVSNTLANHYESIPTRYQGDIKSGILGDVRIMVYKNR